MGIEYDIISDTTKEGFELGKGPWSDLEPALRSLDPVTAVTKLLVESGFEIEHATEIARKIVIFAVDHTDWRVINDCEHDIHVVTDEDRAAYDLQNDDDFPLYRQVGSRYRI